MRRSRKALVIVSVVAAVAMSSGAVAIAATPAEVGALASANGGKGAGYCSIVNSSSNSLGGDQFEDSCANGGIWWCAAFARWVWANEYLNTAGLTDAAASFITSGAGTVHTSSSYVPQVGDAVVYNYDGVSRADHVGVVTAVNLDGSVQTANGDFNGQGTEEVHFAETSTVVIATLAASQRSVGSVPSNIGMQISAYVTPRGMTSGGTSGRDALGVFRHAGTAWELIEDAPGGAVTVPSFGNWSAYGDLPAAGPWGSNGAIAMGVFRKVGSAWELIENTPGGATTVGPFGNWSSYGDTPTWGPWGSGGSPQLGVYRQVGTSLELIENTPGGATTIGPFGVASTDTPTWGYWGSSGAPGFGVFRQDSTAWDLYMKTSTGTVTDGPFGNWNSYGDTPTHGRWGSGDSESIGVFRHDGTAWQLIEETGGGTTTTVGPFGNWNTYGDQPTIGPWG